MISMSRNFAPKAAALLLLLCGAVAEKQLKSRSSHAALHSAFKADVHHQAKHGDVSGLEKTVLAFAKMGKATPGISVFLGQILNITAGMKNDLAVQAEALQTPLTDSWYHFLMCNYSRADDPDYDLPAKNNSHRTCSDNESTTYDAYQQCLSELNDLNDTATTSCALADERCATQPVSCLDNPVQYGSVLPYLQEKYNEFNASYWTCKPAEDACIDARNNSDQKSQDCTALYNQWQGLITECNTLQGDLERAACGDLHRSSDSTCYDYQENCYKPRKATMERNNQSAEDLFNANEASYRGILRIECYLKAFENTTSDATYGEELSDAIEVCKNTRYYGCVYLAPICPNYPPYVNETVPDMTNCSYSPYSSNASLEPGTDAWIQEYYSGMPSNTTFEACSASNATCCGACSALCPTTTSDNHGVAELPIR
jgi:hypothetical protein